MIKKNNINYEKSKYCKGSVGPSGPCGYSEYIAIVKNRKL